MRIDYQPTGIRWLIAGFLLIVAILFGGGGSPAPIAELVVELAALAAVIAWTWLAPRDPTYPRFAVDWPLLFAAGTFVAICLLQLVPLPPTIWHHLPGREIERHALALVEAENAWMPLSVSPTRTLAAFLSLVPPIAMLYFVSRLAVSERSKLLGLLSALALFSVAVGALQLASGESHLLRFYGATNYGFATGFQASRNAQADLLIVASMALAAWAVSSRRIMQSYQARITVGMLAGAIWMAVVMTGSRSGVAMILISLTTCFVIVVGRRWLNARRLLIILLGSLSISIVAGLTFHDNARLERTLTRFDDLEDNRPKVWKDTWYAIVQHWPAGTGIGTFRPVFDASERLEFVRPSYANRAHNDYLEFMLETGIAGILLLVMVLILAVWRVVTMLRRNNNRSSRAQTLFVAGSLLALVLHSLVDYPMRSLSLAVVAGLMAGMLSRSGAIEGGLERRSSGGVED